MKVEFDGEQFAAFLSVVKQTRTGFLINAPRYAAGSTGEAMVRQAAELGNALEEYETLLRKAAQAEADEKAKAQAKPMGEPIGPK